MSGHSKWATIKRQKGVADAKRSQVFTKMAKLITVAAKGGGDPSMNFRLRLAIDRAREVNMPKDNIDRAIKRGAGGGEGAQVEELTYEAYGPGSVAMLIQTLTDNKNRTHSNLKHLLDSSGGRLAEAGSVAWQFELKGVVQAPLPESGRDELELALIEAGASDMTEDAGQLIVTTEPKTLEAVKATLGQRGIVATYADLEMVPKSTTAVADEKTAAKLDELREALDADDDVTATFDNQA
jgi:YebC/PmpR family DNA-binding regulatory protein